MSGPEDARLKSGHGPWTYAAHLFAMTAFAVAQPLYDMFGKYADFFTAHEARAWDLVLLVVLLSFLLPLALLAFEAIAGAIYRPAWQAIHAVLLALLAAVTALPILGRIENLPGWLTILAAGVVGVGFARLVAVRRDFRKLLAYLAVLTLIFPIRFLAFSQTSALVRPEELADLSFLIPGNKVNVVFVVFEELPLVSLMDEGRQIDAVRYPSFATLAEDAHWFRNYTVNGPQTAWSIPAMLTGKYTLTDEALLAGNYPESIFSLLGSSHRIQAFGHSRRVCPRELRNATERRPLLRRMRWTLRDMSVVYLHMILPSGLSARLPPVTDNWADFVSAESDDETDDKKGSRNPRSMQSFVRYVVDEAPSGRPNLSYLHSALAHNPWTALPSGKRYRGSLPGFRRDMPHVLERPGFGGKRWSPDEWLVIQGYQRHLLEVGAADWTLGSLIRRMKEEGIYDESLIVVTSDHGCSFEADQRNRGRKGTVEGDTMPVPLLIKLPHQDQAVINDDNVEAVDLLPTLADILDVDIPWPVDGRSMFDDATPPRAQKTLVYFVDEVRETYVVEGDNQVKDARLARKLELFGSGSSRPDGQFSFGPFAHVVNRRVADLPLVPATELVVDFKEREAFEEVDMTRDVIPSFVSGSITGPSSIRYPVDLAVSVNGTIRATTRSYREPPLDVDAFYSVLPQSALIDGENEIEFYAIHRADGGLVSLSPIGERGSPSG